MLKTQTRSEAGYPEHPTLPDRGMGGKNIFRIFGEASDKWKADVTAWLETWPVKCALIWQEPESKYGPGNVRALSPFIGDPANPWRVTTFIPKNDKLMPFGHQVYPSRVAAMLEEGRHVDRIHSSLPAVVMSEQEIQGYKVKADLAPDTPLNWYKTADVHLLKERIRGSGLIENLVYDSADEQGRIAFTQPIDAKHWEYLRLSAVDQQKVDEDRHAEPVIEIASETVARPRMRA